MMRGTHILSVSIAMSLCTAAHVQAGAAYPRVEGSITLPTLAAQLVQPQDVAAWLAAANLAPAELGRLSAGEHAEMMESMRAAEITLGDRFRLRVLAEAAGFAAAEERPETHGRHEQRQLQEDATKRDDGRRLNRQLGFIRASYCMQRHGETRGTCRARQRGQGRRRS